MAPGRWWLVVGVAGAGVEDVSCEKSASQQPVASGASGRLTVCNESRDGRRLVEWWIRTTEGNALDVSDLEDHVERKASGRLLEDLDRLQLFRAVARDETGFDVSADGLDKVRV